MLAFIFQHPASELTVYQQPRHATYEVDPHGDRWSRKPLSSMPLVATRC